MTDSPISGITIWTASPLGAGLGRGARPRVASVAVASGAVASPAPFSDSALLPLLGGGARAAGAAPLGSISASGLPTSTVSSGCTRILATVPEAGAGTSASTLSVETSTIVLALLDRIPLGTRATPAPSPR